MLLLLLLYLLPSTAWACDPCLEVGSPGPAPDLLAGTYTLLRLEQACPDGCAYTKEGDPDIWCLDSGTYPATATCSSSSSTNNFAPSGTTYTPIFNTSDQTSITDGLSSTTNSGINSTPSTNGNTINTNPSHGSNPSTSSNTISFTTPTSSTTINSTPYFIGSSPSTGMSTTTPSPTTTLSVPPTSLSSVQPTTSPTPPHTLTTMEGTLTTANPTQK